MGWFSKEKPTRDAALFLTEFPSWAAIHSAKLVGELETEDNTGWTDVLKDSSANSRMTNCFIGAHAFYLSQRPEGAIVTALFGENVLKDSLQALPEKAKVFVALAYGLFEKDQLNGKGSLHSSLEDFYKIKIDPLDAYVAFVIDKEVNDSEEFSFRLGGLLPILNRLQVEQLDWLKEMTGKWGKAKA